MILRARWRVRVGLDVGSREEGAPVGGNRVPSPIPGRDREKGPVSI